MSISHDMHTHRSGSSEGYLVNTWVSDKMFASLVAEAWDDVYHSIWNTSFLKEFTQS